MKSIFFMTIFLFNLSTMAEIKLSAVASSQVSQQKIEIVQVLIDEAQNRLPSDFLNKIKNRVEITFDANFPKLAETNTFSRKIKLGQPYIQLLTTDMLQLSANDAVVRKIISSNNTAYRTPYKNVREILTGVILHELAHVFDMSERPTYSPQANALRDSCQNSDNSRNKDCDLFNLGSNSWSGTYEFLNLINWASSGNLLRDRSRTNFLDLRSPDARYFRKLWIGDKRSIAA